MTKAQISIRGMLLALLIIMLWGSCLLFAFRLEVEAAHPLTYLLVLLQMHLFTGLFITAHDAMHGVVCPTHPRLNHWVGRLCAALFVYNSYSRLRPRHYRHHRLVATASDPDYHAGNPAFLPWYFKFLREYVSWWQILLAAITYNLLILVVPVPNVLLYWVLPSVLSTFQLFYFGTYLPHKGEHDVHNLHKARSQPKHHLWAFLSCYFFGYHYEHHDKPNLPWWLLWREVK